MTSELLDMLLSCPPADDDVLRSGAFKRIAADVAYFEGYVSMDGIPDPIALIKELIFASAEAIDARLSLHVEDGRIGLALGPSEEDGTRYAVVGPEELHPTGIVMRLKACGSDSLVVPAVHIADDADSKGIGVTINAYNIPPETIAPMLRYFSRLENKDRNDTIRAFTVAEVIAKGYASSSSFMIRQLEEDIAKHGTTLPGIDEDNVYTLSQERPDMSVYAASCGYHGFSTVDLTLRIARPGIEFRFPSTQKL